MRVTPAAASPGEEVVVELIDWPPGPVLVSVCGNNARRGSEDCNLAGTKAVDVYGGARTFRLRVTSPPIHCPCVVRATTQRTDVVRQAPLDVVGHPSGPELLPEHQPVAASEVPIRARLIDADQGWTGALLPLVAGPTNRTLAVTVRNDSDQAVEQVRIVGSVGRSRSSAEPIASATIDELAAGEQRTVRIPVRIGVPAWGDYDVFGSVYGLDVPARFSVETTNDPWGLEIALPLLVLILAWLARRREDRADALLQEDSPSVGAGDEDRSSAPFYAPLHAAST